MSTITHLTVAALLSVFVSFLVACSDGDQAEPVACILPDGTELAAGQSAGDPCRGCSPATGELEIVWKEGCVAPLPWTALWSAEQVAVIELGPDADGGGWGDIVMGGVDMWPAWKGNVGVFSTETGELMLEVSGEDSNDMFGVRGPNVALGPDVDGDGLADLAASSANSLNDIDWMVGENGADGLFPNPGWVEIWSPAQMERLGRLEEADACRSFGYSIDLGGDLDGDGLGELVLTDAGCFDFVEEDGALIPVSNGDSILRVYRGDGSEVLWTEEADTVRGAIGNNHVQFVHHLPDTDPVFAYRRRAGGRIEPEREPETLLHRGPAFEPLRTWGSFDLDGIHRRVHPWHFGWDMDLDGEEDAVGRVMRAPGGDIDRPVQLYPGLQRPVGSAVVYTDCGGLENDFSIVPDIDADGGPDIFITCYEGEDVAAFVNGQTGRLIWSTPLEFGDAVAHPYDIDGDGCVDIAIYRQSLRQIELIRCNAGE